MKWFALCMILALPAQAGDCNKFADGVRGETAKSKLLGLIRTVLAIPLATEIHKDLTYLWGLVRSSGAPTLNEDAHLYTAAVESLAAVAADPEMASLAQDEVVNLTAYLADSSLETFRTPVRPSVDGPVQVEDPILARLIQMTDTLEFFEAVDPEFTQGQRKIFVATEVKDAFASLWFELRDERRARNFRLIGTISNNPEISLLNIGSVKGIVETSLFESHFMGPNSARVFFGVLPGGHIVILGMMTKNQSTHQSRIIQAASALFERVLSRYRSLP